MSESTSPRSTPRSERLRTPPPPLPPPPPPPLPALPRRCARASPPVGRTRRQNESALPPRDFLGDGESSSRSELSVLCAQHGRNT